MGNYVETVAESIIQQLKQGTAPWQKPWRAGERYVPYNPSSEKPYRGMNVLWLLSQGEEKGYSDKRWMTYRQAATEGAQVRKGEKGTVVQYWKWQDLIPVKDAQGRPVLDGLGKPKQEVVKYERPRVFGAVVFNAEQMDGLEPAPERDPPSVWAANEKADAILLASGAKIDHHSQDRAYYSVPQDKITLPLRERFPTADGYFATALHELGHWTGHPTRLDRDLAHPFGSEGYAKEELRAEIASLMLGDELSIGHDPTQHVAYVKSWIKVLENDPKEIFRAATAAEKIKDYVLTLAQQQRHDTEQEPDRVQTHDAAARSAMAQHVNATGQERPGALTDPAAARLTEVRTIEPSYAQGMSGSGPNPTQEENMETQEGLRYLSVPYKEKDAARRAGARWDNRAKSWYAPAGVALDSLVKWLPDKSRDALTISALSPRDEFAAALKEAGLMLEGLPDMDGTLRRVRVEGESATKKSGSYVGFLDGHPAGYINNFKTGVELNWKSQIPVTAVTGEVMAELRREATQRQAQREEQMRLTQAAAAARSERVLAAGTVPSADHAYLKSKGLDGNPHHLTVDRFGNLLLAAQDVDGKLRSLQRIRPDGTKLFTKGGRMDGSHALLSADGGNVGTVGTLIIAEGYATAATIEQSTKLTVAVAFSAGNLLPVASAYRQKYPTLTIIVAGDNDHQKPLQIGADGQPKRNLGLEKAVLAAEAIGGYALLPPFKAGEEGTDWNDFERLHGRDATRQTLTAGLAVAQVHLTAGHIKREPGLEFANLTPDQQAQAESMYSTSRAMVGYRYTLNQHGQVLSRKKDDFMARDSAEQKDEHLLSDDRMIDADRRRVREAAGSGHDGEMVAETVRLHQAMASEQDRPAQTRSRLDTLRNVAESEAETQELQPKLRRGRSA
jgi:putative DNA primase/helicase